MNSKLAASLTAVLLPACVVHTLNSGSGTPGASGMSGNMPDSVREAASALDHAIAVQGDNGGLQPLPQGAAALEKRVVQVKADLERARPVFGHGETPVPDGVDGYQFGIAVGRFELQMTELSWTEEALEMERSWERFRRDQSLEAARAAKKAADNLVATMDMPRNASVAPTFCVNCKQYEAELAAAIPKLEQRDLAGTGGANVPSLEVSDKRVSASITVKNGMGALVIRTPKMSDLEVSAVKPGDRDVKYHLLDCPADARDPSQCTRLGNEVTVSGEQRIWVHVDRENDNTRHPSDGTIVVVAQPKGLSASYVESLIGEPPASASPHGRNVADYGLSENHADGYSHSRWVRAADLFANGPRAFVVYARMEIPVVFGETPLAVNEPVILVGDRHVLRANGELVQLNLSQSQQQMFDRKHVHSEDELFSVEKPANVVLPAPISDEEPDGKKLFEGFDSDFTVFEGVNDPRVAAHQKETNKVGACAAKVTGTINKKLGNGGFVGGWEVHTERADGTLIKRETLSEFEEGKARKACAVANLEKKRLALRRALRTEALARVAKALQ